jgi:hypothetical protein
MDSLNSYIFKIQINDYVFSTEQGTTHDASELAESNQQSCLR